VHASSAFSRLIFRLPILISKASEKATNSVGVESSNRSVITPNLGKADAGVHFAMRYLVKARVKTGRAVALAKAIANRTLGRGSIAGDEYLYDMQMARVNATGEARWVETCFCDPPLEEERPYWEEYFDLLSVKDAHSRRNCRHENGTEPWECCDCDCTKRLEARLARTGQSFLHKLNSL
jgi:hypothetical protein